MHRKFKLRLLMSVNQALQLKSIWTESKSIHLCQMQIQNSFQLSNERFSKRGTFRGQSFRCEGYDPGTHGMSFSDDPGTHGMSSSDDPGTHGMLSGDVISGGNP